MLRKCNTADIGYAVCGPWLFAHKFFPDNDVFAFLQSGDMAGQVAVGNIQQMLERIKINVFIHAQHGHNTQPYPAFEGFIKIVYVEIFAHLSYL